jgi:tetratricopeptide (TPR) repeat protein
MKSTTTILTCLALLGCAAAQANELTPDQLEQVKLNSFKWMKDERKADGLFKSGKYEDATAIYLKVLDERRALDLDLLPDFDALASVYLKWGKPEMALKAYQDMVAAREKMSGLDSPDVVYPLKQYGACLKKLGKTAEAQTVLARVAAIEKENNGTPKFGKITTAKGSPERLLEAAEMRALGEKFMKRDAQDKAFLYFNRAVELYPDDPLAICERGETEEFLQKSPKALADFTKAISLKPDLRKAYVDRALLHAGENRDVQALADYDKAKELDAGDAESMGDRAKLLDHMGRHAAAIDGFTQIIAQHPKLYWPYADRAECYKATGQYKKAIEDWTTLVARAPEDQDFLHARAQVYAKAGDFKNALVDYDKLIEINPLYSLGYQERAKIYEKLDGKKSPRAVADYAMAKKLGY